MAKNIINEDLKRFKSLLGYDPSKGNSINERVQPWRYSLNEAEPGEEEENTEETEEENTDFDFGDAGNPEDDAVADEVEGGDEVEEKEGEEPTDEFGTANEFSAADELEDEESDVEEIDVTSIVSKSDEAREMAQQAVSVGQENMSYLKSLTDKLSNLESQLTKMDTIASKITKLEQDIKTPEEKLELRSLDSYPFNMKLTDYWEEKAAKDKNYRISGGESFEDGEKKEYVITPEMINNINPTDINRKKIIKENKKLTDYTREELIDYKKKLEDSISGIDERDPLYGDGARTTMLTINSIEKILEKK
jgi:hypothetical protein